MKANYAILALGALVLMTITAVAGTVFEGADLQNRHVLLGVLAAVFTCFVHVVYFVYFIVQEKIVSQSIAHHALSASFHPRIQRLKSRGLRLSMAGIATIILATITGSGVNIAWGGIVHQSLAYAALTTNAFVFFRQFVLLGDYAGVFHEAFGE